MTIQLFLARFRHSWGALVGGGALLLGAIYSQRSQDRLQRVASEIAKRETVYADFVMSASNLLLNAYTHDEIALSGDELSKPSPRRGHHGRPIVLDQHIDAFDEPQKQRLSFGRG